MANLTNNSLNVTALCVASSAGSMHLLDGLKSRAIPSQSFSSFIVLCLLLIMIGLLMHLSLDSGMRGVLSPPRKIVRKVGSKLRIPQRSRRPELVKSLEGQV